MSTGAWMEIAAAAAPKLATLALFGMCNWVYRSREVWALSVEELTRFYGDMAIRALSPRAE